MNPIETATDTLRRHRLLPEGASLVRLPCEDGWFVAVAGIDDYHARFYLSTAGLLYRVPATCLLASDFLRRFPAGEGRERLLVS